MQVFFKMIIDDGEKYYAGEDPGVAICDYVYMRGLNGIDDNTFWENQRKHYREHMQFVFTFIPNPRSTLVDVAEEIVKRIELDPQKFIEFRVPIYILENLELVEIEDPTIPLSTISKYYDISKALHIFFVLSNQAGDIWVEDGLRYYMHSKEAGRHNLPHIHVDYKHEYNGVRNRMSKRGSPYLRHAIWLAASSAVLHDPALKLYFQKKRDEGKPYMASVGHACRKMVSIIYAVMRDNKAYTPYIPNEISA